MTVQAQDILDFWFEGDGSVRRDKWFKKDSDFDAACARYTADIRAARASQYDAWTATPRGTLALIVLMDQLSRNVFRGSAESFAADPHARQIARAMVARGDDKRGDDKPGDDKRGGDKDLTPFERMFVYLPFEHGETIEDQDDSVRLFEPLREALGAGTVDYAERHRAVIRRFGRFPHRNAVLGRIDTPEEKDYLSQPGAGF